MPYGTPFESVSFPSLTSTHIVEPSMGYDTSRSPLNIEVGATPNSDNYLLKDGRLRVRSALSRIAGNEPQDIAFGSGSKIRVGGLDVVDVNGVHYLMVAERAEPSNGQTELPWLSSGDTLWSQSAEYVTAAGIYDPPVMGDDDYWDWTQIYSDRNDENIAVGAVTSRMSGLYAWLPGNTAYSTLTGSPGAKVVAAIDNYLVAANTAEGSIVYPQRVRWSDRGSASSWTGGSSGFEDLLQARGGVTRLLPLGARLIVFFEDEIWQGVRADLPFTFNFSALDSKVGCPWPWTATETPLGIMFLGRDYQVYLLPKDGGPAQPVGQRLYRTLRDTIQQPSRAFSVYDAINHHYQLYYASGNSNNIPHRAAFLQLDNGAWAPQSFDSNNVLLYRGFSALRSPSNATTWDEMTASWDSVSQSWDAFLGIGNERAALVILGDRNVFEYSSVLTRDQWRSDSTLTNYSTVLAYWESRPLEDATPGAQKTMTEVRVEYTGTAASNLSVRVSPSQGAAFAAGSAVSLAATSGVSQAIAYPYVAARYPTLRVESEGANSGHELSRFHVTSRVGGR